VAASHIVRAAKLGEILEAARLAAQNAV